MDKQISISKYKNEDKDAWNKFLSRSKNGLFMFDRNYMEYHSDRFKDHSLLFYYGDDLVSIFPASEHEETIISHGGLTYGGLITDESIKQHMVIDCVKCLKEYANNNGFTNIVYKAIPHIYHIQPAQEDIYALYQQGGKLRNVTASTVIDLKQPVQMAKLRKRQINKANREGVRVEHLYEKRDYDVFIELLNGVLKERHGLQAVHTSDELFFLHSNFPRSIHLYGAFSGETMIAGTVLFEYRNAIHTQYLASDSEGRENGALDITIATVMSEYKDKKRWLDFGISTDHSGLELNEGLIAQKEGFGGRTNVYTQWEIRV